MCRVGKVSVSRRYRDSGVEGGARPRVGVETVVWSGLSVGFGVGVVDKSSVA